MESVIGLERFEMARGERFDTHTHGEHQLVWASKGLLTVDIADRYWLLPPTLALWVPAGVPHAPTALRESVMEGVYLDGELVDLRWSEPTVVLMDPLAQHLIAYLRGDLDPQARGRAEQVLLDALRPARLAAISLPVPADARGAELARRILADPADQRTLADHGREIGASSRTLLRIFLTETGLPFSTWRTHARLQAAVVLLAEGHTVSQAAYRVGYGTPSSFIAAFHRTTGQTPGSYFG